MLIGAHVSPAGGPANAVTRGEERGCRAIQIFNQSPRAWRARIYSSEEVEAFHAAMKGSPVEALVIHAVYLLNCASEDQEIRDKSLAALIVALNAGAQLKAHGVVLHPGSALKSPPEEALKRAATVIQEALKESDGRCPLLLEDTAGAGGTLGRSFEELAQLIELIGGQKRVGVCLDSCHLFASGYDVRTRESLSEVIDEFDRVVGCDRLGALHVNDSVTELGSNRDRHANLGDGEIGLEGMIAFLSEPRFEGLPMIFEGPGREGKAVEPVDMAWAHDLRSRGLARQLGRG
jgi:deoxyribonuclease-4